MLIKVLVETEIDKKDLFEAIYGTCSDDLDTIESNWDNYKEEIIDKLYFFDIVDEVLDVQLDEVINTPGFWEEFREYITKNCI